MLCTWCVSHGSRASCKLEHHTMSLSVQCSCEGCLQNLFVLTYVVVVRQLEGCTYAIIRDSTFHNPCALAKAVYIMSQWDCLVCVAHNSKVTHRQVPCSTQMLVCNVSLASGSFSLHVARPTASQEHTPIRAAELLRLFV